MNPEFINKKINLKDIYTNPENYNDFLNYPGYLIYKIENELNNECYVGSTKQNLYERFFGSAPWTHFKLLLGNYNIHRYSAIRKYGIENFTLSIISINKNDLEVDFIKKFDSFYNGYNENFNGLGISGPTNLGKILINNGIKNKFIKPTELDKYLSEGWIKGTINQVSTFGDNVKGKIRIHKDDIDKFILPEYLDKFIELGWVKGVSYSDKNIFRFKTITITKNSINKLIGRSELDHYISLGWKIGQYRRITQKLLDRWYSHKNWLNKGGVNKYVTDNLVDGLIKDGWVIGRILSESNQSLMTKNSHRSRFINNGDKLLDYLFSNEIEITEDNFNHNRSKLNIPLKFIPRYETYNKYKLKK